jgi:cbb3-type cytochrome oxidase cytochrome c subunit
MTRTDKKVLKTFISLLILFGLIFFSFKLDVAITPDMHESVMASKVKKVYDETVFVKMKSCYTCHSNMDVLFIR